MRKGMATRTKAVIWPRHKRRDYVAVSRKHGVKFSGFYPVTYPDKWKNKEGSHEK